MNMGNPGCIRVLVMGIGFMFLMSAFYVFMLTLVIIEGVRFKELNFTGIGFSSIIIIYIAFAASVFFIPPFISITGPKFSMMMGSALFILFMASLIKPHPTFMYIVSVLAGVGLALLWVGQGNYLVRNSTKENIFINSALFWAIFQISLVFGSIFIHFRFLDVEFFDEKHKIALVWLLIGTSSISVIIFSLLPSCIKHDAISDSSSNKPINMFQIIRGIGKLMESLHFRLLYIPFFLLGANIIFIMMYYQVSIAHNLQFERPKQLAPLAGVFVGLGEVLCSCALLCFGFMIEKPSRIAIFVFGSITNILAILLVFVNLPNEAPFGDTEDKSLIESSAIIVVGSSFMLGISDACLNTQIITTLGSKYPKNSASVFAAFKFFQTFGILAMIFFSNFLILYVVLVILIVFTILTMVCYVISERIEVDEDKIFDYITKKMKEGYQDTSHFHARHFPSLPHFIASAKNSAADHKLSSKTPDVLPPKILAESNIKKPNDQVNNNKLYKSEVYPTIPMDDLNKPENDLNKSEHSNNHEDEPKKHGPENPENDIKKPENDLNKVEDVPNKPDEDDSNKSKDDPNKPEDGLNNAEDDSKKSDDHYNKPENNPIESESDTNNLTYDSDKLKVAPDKPINNSDKRKEYSIEIVDRPNKAEDNTNKLKNATNEPKDDINELESHSLTELTKTVPEKVIVTEDIPPKSDIQSTQETKEKLDSTLERSTSRRQRVSERPSFLRRLLGFPEPEMSEEELQSKTSTTPAPKEEVTPLSPPSLPGKATKEITSPIESTTSSYPSRPNVNIEPTFSEKIDEATPSPHQTRTPTSSRRRRISKQITSPPLSDEVKSSTHTIPAILPETANEITPLSHETKSSSPSHRKTSIRTSPPSLIDGVNPSTDIEINDSKLPKLTNENAPALRTPSPPRRRKSYIQVTTDDSSTPKAGYKTFPVPPTSTDEKDEDTTSRREDKDDTEILKSLSPMPEKLTPRSPRGKSKARKLASTNKSESEVPPIKKKKRHLKHLETETSKND